MSAQMPVTTRTDVARHVPERSQNELPLIVRPPDSDARNLHAWHAANGDFVQAALCKHGAVLFRDFHLPDAQAFCSAFSALAGVPLPYFERSSPRRVVAQGVFTSTVYPSTRAIQLHNEQSYNLNFPRLIAFFCERPGDRGGETPLADVRKVLGRLDPSRVERLIENGYCYARYFGKHFGLPWKDAFQVDEPSAVERYCAENGVEFEWVDQPGGALRTRQYRPVVARHPLTGELVWFNHLAFFHTSSLEPDLYEMLRTSLQADQFPHATSHVDGSAIDPDLMSHIRDAYRAEEKVFSWQAGDLLLVDNMLVAHARNPYVGNRSVLVCMGELQTWSTVRVGAAAFRV